MFKPKRSKHYNPFRLTEFSILVYFEKNKNRQDITKSEVRRKVGFSDLNDKGPMGTEHKRMIYKRSSWLQFKEVSRVFDSLLEDGLIQKGSIWKNYQGYGITEKGIEDVKVMKERLRWLKPATMW